MTSLLTLTLPSRRALLVGAAIVLALGLLGTAGWFWYASEQQRAMAAYADAMTQVQAATKRQGSPEARAAAIRRLEIVIERYPSAPVAAQVAYELGNLRYAAREYTQARGAYEIAIAKGATPTVRALARAGVAYAWEAERNFPKAVDAFQAALAGRAPTDFLYEELLLGLARTQELAGRKADAVATYRRILKEGHLSRRADEVRFRLASLGVSAD
ncbi:MAG: tetratricopeptide repeat protein [Candidatus Rokubacteria bacterium]|nr:tetratricopeptide repeat protein [Candidatus Rokubacteria bacterium]